LLFVTEVGQSQLLPQETRLDLEPLAPTVIIPAKRRGGMAGLKPASDVDAAAPTMATSRSVLIAPSGQRHHSDPRMLGGGRAVISGV
jgi:hypothetical protein